MSDSTHSQNTSQILSRSLPNGVTILGQPMPWLRSASFAIVLPAGSQFEVESRFGLAGVTCEMVQRGAGSYSSREIVSLGDNLGLERNASISAAHTLFGVSMPSESLTSAIDLYTEIVRRPHLPQDQLEDARSVAIQELRATEDEPVQRVMIRLKEMQYGVPLGHSALGNMAGLQAIDAADVRSYFENHYQPNGTIITVAGNFDWEQVSDHIAENFTDWLPKPTGDVPLPDGNAGYEFLQHPSQQTHIGFAFPALPYGHEDYFTLRAAIGVLSDGMSSRLFDRVREQRGLCYTVSAMAHSLKGVGGVLGYAGTTPERAQETLDVTLHEIAELGSTVADDELDRFKVRIQSNLVMQLESSASRASSMATDLYYLGRVLEPSEIEASVDAVTPEKIAAVWESLGMDQLRIVTSGPEPLRVPTVA